MKSRTHANALFDEVVLVSLQLILKSQRLFGISLLLVIRPALIQEVLGITITRDGLKQSHCIIEVLNIRTVPRFFDGELGGFFSKWWTAYADQI